MSSLIDKNFAEENLDILALTEILRLKRKYIIAMSRKF